MMRLSMMRDFLERADSAEQHPVVQAALGKFGYDEGSVRFFRASANFVFRFRKNEKEHVLRVTDARDRTEEQLRAEIDFLQFLIERGAPVNRPFARESCESELGTFHAVVFDFLGGELHDFEELAEEQFSRWGEALGRLHALSQQYQPTGDAVRPSCFDQLQEVRDALPAHETAARAEVERIEAWMAGLERKASNFGLIHFDFELDNLIWNDETVQMIDFDSAAYSWYGADLAYALRDLFEDGCDLSHPKFLRFLEGYRKHARIDDADVQEIPMFLRLHNLLTFTGLLASADLPQTAEVSPEWAVHLQRKLEHKIEAYRRGMLSGT